MSNRSKWIWAAATVALLLGVAWMPVQILQSPRVNGGMMIGTGTPSVALLDGGLYIAGTIEADGAARFDGGTAFAGATTIGGGTGTLLIDTTSWDVSAAGIGSGFTGFASTGAISLGGGTGTVAIDTTSWDVSAAGVASGLTGLTVAGGAVSLNLNSNFATSISTGTSTGAITLGGGSGTVAVDSTSWDVSAAGAFTGLSGIVSSGLANFTGDVNLGDSAADLITIFGTLQGNVPLVFEGGTANAHETSLAITDPTLDRTITVPDKDARIGEHIWSVYIQGELGDGAKSGCLYGACTGLGSATPGRADLDTFYVDNDAGASDISATQDAADANSAAAADVAMFADAATEAIGDAIYIGSYRKFWGVHLTLSQGATWSGPGNHGRWEYATAPDTWAALTMVEDSTISANDSLEQTGLVLFVPPTDWVRSDGGTKNLDDAAFYIRFVLLAAEMTQVPIGSQLRLVAPDTDQDLPRAPFAFSLFEVQASCITAPAGTATLVDVCNATSMACGRLTIADGQFSDRVTSLAVPFAAGDEMVINAPNDSSGVTSAENCNIVLYGR